MEKGFDHLVEKAVELGASEAAILDTDRIVFDSRSHLKCRFGCNRWGRYWTCPPHLDISPEAFMDGFSRFHKAIIIKTTDPKVGQDVTLAIEKDAMLSLGCSFPFAMALCVQCDECAYPEPCKYPHLARPSMDAYGIDIGKTVEPLGFKVEFDPEGKLLPAWYSMVLIDQANCGMKEEGAVSVGIICCRVLEKEIREVVRHVPEVTHVDVMEWGLHIHPDVLLETLCKQIRMIENRVDAIMLGYGRCQALDRLPDDFAVPVFYPEGEDCIGVLLGQDQYERELKQTAGTWFLTPGWTELGMEFIFEELQVQRVAKKGHDPLRLAHRMLKDFSRALLIDMQLKGNDAIKREALAIAAEFGWKLDKVEGSLVRLKQTLQKAIEAATSPSLFS